MKTPVHILSLILSTACFALATPGDLDPTFGTAGKVVTPFGSGTDFANSVAVQSDGKIVVAGFANSDFGIARYNADGSMDSSFGSGGKVTTDFNAGWDSAESVMLQSDGKLIVAGSTYTGGSSHFALARYNIDGSLDSSFGDQGKAVALLGNGADGRCAALQSDGKIIVAGSTDILKGPELIALARYNANGSLDTTFGSGGKVLAPDVDSPTGAWVSCVLVQINGKIVVAGGAYSRSMLLRYNTNGSLDPTFGSGGKAFNSIGSGENKVESMCMQPDGKIVSIGWTNEPHSLALARYNVNGTLDSSFGSGGKVITSSAYYHLEGQGVAVQTDGKIVVVGNSSNSTVDVMLARYNPDGTLDNTFGNNGLVIPTTGSSNRSASSMALQSDGKILIAGGSDYNGTSDFLVARYSDFDATPELQVEYPLGTNLLNSSGLINFGILFTGRSGDRVITAKNIGAADLTGVTVTVTGANATDFNVVGSLSSVVAPENSAAITVRFSPVNIGAKNATLHITSNDSDENPFDIALTGQAIDPNADFDGDGVPNVAEENLTSLGFDPFVSNASLVTLLRNNGLYRVADMQTLALGSPLLERDPATGRFHLNISVEKTTDLKNWTPLTDFTPTFNAASGKVDIEITPGATNTSFFRVLGSKP